MMPKRGSLTKDRIDSTRFIGQLLATPGSIPLEAGLKDCSAQPVPPCTHSAGGLARFQKSDTLPHIDHRNPRGVIRHPECQGERPLLRREPGAELNLGAKECEGL
jgi:hypothetical protein